MTGYCRRCRLFTFIERDSKLCVNCTNYSEAVVLTSTTENSNFFSSVKQLELEFPEES